MFVGRLVVNHVIIKLEFLLYFKRAFNAAITYSNI
jgi:hypothetical protein